MNKFLIILSLLHLLDCSLGHPHLYNPYYSFFRYNDPYYSLTNYANQIQPYGPILPPSYYQDNILTSYISQPNNLPTLNVLAEVPYEIKNDFTVVPMLVVSKENMKMIENGEIMGVSQKKPTMTVKTQDNKVVLCSPAVKIVLRKPILVYSLKSSIVFPAEINILHGDYSIPIRVGAVIAPVPENAFISTETPVALSVVYAVPTKPVNLDYVNKEGVAVNNDNQAVIIDSQPVLPPRNITIINFPEKLAEPVLEVDEEDDELVNRNPPIVLAPAGIVQSTQPHTIVSPFLNSKESPVLTALREEALKRL